MKSFDAVRGLAMVLMADLRKIAPDSRRLLKGYL